MRKADPHPSASWAEIAVILLDDDGIAAANRRVFGRDAVTDVISQVYDPLPGQGRCGEVLINVERACEEAGRRPAWSAEHEFALYIAHGCDHLAGEDDADDPGRRRMRRRELKWVGETGKAGLIAELFLYT